MTNGPGKPVGVETASRDHNGQGSDHSAKRDDRENRSWLFMVADPTAPISAAVPQAMRCRSRGKSAVCVSFDSRARNRSSPNANLPRRASVPHRVDIREGEVGLAAFGQHQHAVGYRWSAARR
jgi:hypothetical protein